MTIAFAPASDIFICVLQRLMHWCPLQCPVFITRAITLENDYFGTFQIKRHTVSLLPLEDKFHFYIGIRIQSDPQYECETLIHEWAHAKTYDKTRPSRTCKNGDETIVVSSSMPLEDHGNEWGKAYAECYTAARKQLPSKSETSLTSECIIKRVEKHG